MKSGIIRFVFEHGRPDELVRFSLDDGDVRVLRNYLAEAYQLENLLVEFEQHSVGFTISARVGASVEIAPRELTVLQRAGLLHHLRPFVLDNEPHSFFRVRNIVARGLEGDFAKDWLEQLKRIFAGVHLQNQVRISSGDVLVNSEKTLQLWLNAFEYHRDQDKAEKMEQTLAPLPKGITRPVFVMMLLQKADAVRYLGHVVYKLLEAIDQQGSEGA